MKIVIDKDAIKYLNSITDNDKQRILNKLNEFKTAIEKQMFIPYKLFNIKELHGLWDGFYRLRIGPYRIIFKFIREEMELRIYHIHPRGDIYKKK
jgi:mRNA interferase RelE/StbE